MRPERWLYTIPLRLRSLFRRAQTDRELDEELRDHLERRTNEYVAGGMVPKEAHRRSQLDLGGIEQTKEQCRAARRVNWIQDFIGDLRHGLRGLRKNVGVTTIVVLTLAVGVGANTAIFGLVNGILLQRLPVSHPEQIAALVIQSSGSALGALGFSYPQLAEFRQQAAPYCDVFGQALGRVSLTVGAHTDLVAVSGVSSNYFSTLGLRPALGRLILPDEPERPGAVVLGYTFWQRRFGGDPAVIGMQVHVEGRPATIVGVVPRGFRGQFAGFELDAYLPLSTYFPGPSSASFWTNRDQHIMLSLARLKSGVTIAQAQARFDVISQRLAAQYPASDRNIRVRVMDERLARPIPYANSAFIMLSAVFLILGALVLLLACTNIANILMARASVRRKEMAVRTALGAARSRLVRQMLAETLLTSALGGFAGVTLGAWLTHMLRALRLSGFPMRLDFDFDWRVFAYALLAVLFTALLAGLSPALRATRADVNVVLHQGGRPDAPGGAPHKVRGDLMAAQVAGSFALLIVAGLFVRGLQAVQRLDLGFDPNQLLNVSLDPSLSNYDQTQATNFYRALEARIRALPGVQGATLAASVPIAYSEGNHSVFIEGQPLGPGQHASVVMSNTVDSAYFETLRIPILSGRSFTDADDEASLRVAIVNETLARRFWPGQNPIGKRFSLVSDAGPFLQIVGVARDGKYRNVTEGPQPYFYLPLAQNFFMERVLQVRSVLAPESLMPLVQEEILALDGSSVIVSIQTMKQSLNGALGYFMFRLGASLAACMGLLGLLLAVVGVYGVVSYAAAQRTRELAIRIALGASTRQILSLLLNQGARLVAAGLLFGLAGALALTRAMAHMLVGVSPNDPLTYISVAALLSFVTLLACWIPARRALRADPMLGLRYE